MPAPTTATATGAGSRHSPRWATSGSSPAWGWRPGSSPGWSAALGQGGRFSFARGWLLLFALGLLWATLRALWVRFDEPDGVPLEREDAPALFEALDRIRQRIDGPAVHRIYLDSEFNASIRQLPRFGLFGGAVNHLSIGLPLLMALDRRRLLSVLAHEYGHLRGNHGKLSAWIYRTRMSWLKLDASFQRDEGVMAFASQAFFRWYFPRFAAKTFALARQDEYEADRVAARLLGTRVVAGALTEIAVKSAWYAETFWPAHWSRAADEPMPAGPFSAMAAQLRAPMAPDFARAALRAALRSVSDVDDTHPVLRDRLEALDEKPGLPSWSEKSALALLADAPRWTAHFDDEWRRDHANDWKQHHAYLVRVGERVAALAASAGRNNADEMVEWADCARRLDAAADVRGHYERALQLTENHPGALRGLAQLLPARDRSARLAVLERLHESSVASRWWAARTAVGLLEDPDAGGHDERALKLWRERTKTAEEAEQRAWEEITATPCFSHIARHDLSEFELGELRADLARCLRGVAGLAGAQEPARIPVAARLRAVPRAAADGRRRALAAVPAARTDPEPAGRRAGAVGRPFADAGADRAPGVRRDLGPTHEGHAHCV